MKEMLKESPLPVSELVVDGVYMTHTKDLVQVKSIDSKKDTLHVYNITESCNIYGSLAKHLLVKRIR